MNLDLQFKIKNNPHYKQFLRENSYWYKELNRNPDRIRVLDEKMKEQYKLRTSDKIDSFAEKIKLVRTFFDVLR